MIPLIGIRSSEPQLRVENFVGILLFAEFPTTQLYDNGYGEPIIKEWVDVDRENGIDRYFYYATSKYLLYEFINERISHVDLIQNTPSGFLYFQDVRGQEVISNIVVSSKQLPIDYSPSPNFYFMQEDGVDIDNIIQYFGLRDAAANDYVDEKLRIVARSKNSETLNLHFKHGIGIGFGTVNTDVLGKTLMGFDRFFREMAIDHLMGHQRGDLANSPKKIQEILPFITTEVYSSIAASYSVLLRPKAIQQNLFNEESSTKVISDNIFRLIENSDKPEELREEYFKHSDFTINSYKKFLKGVYELQLNLELNWFNPKNDFFMERNVDYRFANRTLINLENLEVESTESFNKKGRFRAINCDTGHFTFASTDEEQFFGYFDRLIQEGSETISFLAIYDVTISRKTVKQPGKEKARVIDTIMAFYEDKG